MADIAICHQIKGKDYALQFRVKSAPFLDAMKEAGFRTFADLARVAGVSPSQIGDYVNLKIAPIDAQGRWRQPIQRIAVALRRTPEMLFPSQHLNKALKKNTGEVRLSRKEVEEFVRGARFGLVETANPETKLLTSDVDADGVIGAALQTLTPREERVLRERFGIGCDSCTIEEVAQEFSITRERIRQIEAKALQKLKKAALLRKWSAPNGYGLHDALDAYASE